MFSPANRSQAIDPLCSFSHIGRLTVEPSSLEWSVGCEIWPPAGWCCRGYHGPLARYIKLRVVHAPGTPGTFSRHRHQRKPQVSDSGMHHGTSVTHVPWYMLGSLTPNEGENGPGIPGACATRNFTCLVNGPWVDINTDWGTIHLQWIISKLMCNVDSRNRQEFPPF